jgi:cytochrome c6
MPKKGRDGSVNHLAENMAESGSRQSQGSEIVLKKWLVISIVGLLIWSLTVPVKAATADAAKLFEIQCAGCHVNGGNIIRRGKTLKLKALEKNGYSTIETISEIITNGKANMSAFGDRLSPEEIQALANYVLDQANKNWR